MTPPPNNPQVEEKFEKSTHTLEHGESLTSHFSKPCKCHKSPKPDTSHEKCVSCTCKNYFDKAKPECYCECHPPKPDSRREEVEESLHSLCSFEKHDSGCRLRLQMTGIQCDCNYGHKMIIRRYIDSLQAQNAELVSKVKVAEEALDCAKVDQECREGCNCEVCQALAIIRSSPSSK